VLTLLLGLACHDSSDAQRSNTAGHAPDLRAAWSSCRWMTDPYERAACEVAVIGRFHAYGRCADVSVQAWRDECRFAAAEWTAARGDTRAALLACAGTAFARQCRQHMVEGIAAAALDLSVPDAAVAYTRESEALAAADGHAQVRGELDFWRAWFRLRAERGLSAIPESCPDRACRDGARHELRRLAAAWYAERGCSASTPAWAVSEDALRWAREARAEHCGRDGIVQPQGPR
jgi:hypothetical protein